MKYTVILALLFIGFVQCELGLPENQQLPSEGEENHEHGSDCGHDHRHTREISGEELQGSGNNEEMNETVTDKSSDRLAREIETTTVINSESTQNSVRGKRDTEESSTEINQENVTAQSSEEIENHSRAAREIETTTVNDFVTESSERVAREIDTTTVTNVDEENLRIAREIETTPVIDFAGGVINKRVSRSIQYPPNDKPEELSFETFLVDIPDNSRTMREIEMTTVVNSETTENAKHEKRDAEESSTEINQENVTTQSSEEIDNHSRTLREIETTTVNDFVTKSSGRVAREIDSSTEISKENSTGKSEENSEENLRVVREIQSTTVVDGIIKNSEEKNENNSRVAREIEVTTVNDFVTERSKRIAREIENSNEEGIEEETTVEIDSDQEINDRVEREIQYSSVTNFPYPYAVIAEEGHKFTDCDLPSAPMVISEAGKECLLMKSSHIDYYPDPIMNIERGENYVIFKYSTNGAVVKYSCEIGRLGDTLIGEHRDYKMFGTTHHFERLWNPKTNRVHFEKCEHDEPGLYNNY